MRTWTILLALILCCSCGREPTAQPDARLDPQKQRTRDFWTAYREANQLRSRGDFEAAVPAYRRALDVDPKHEDSLYYLGASLEEVGEYTRAAETYERLIELNPASGRGLTQLASVLSSLAPGAPWNPDRAAGLLHRAVELNREQAGPFQQLGRLELDQGRYKTALEHFHIAARFGSPEGRYWAGYALFLQGNRAAAAQEFQRTREAYAREEKMSQAGVRSEGDVLPKPGRQLTALERAGIKAQLFLHWIKGELAASPVRPIPGVKPAGRASVGDFDGDGRPDLLTAGAQVALYRNLGGTFADATAAAGLAGIKDVRDSAWADFDGDNHQDLYLIGSGGRNRLYRNLGDGSFTDVTASGGLAGARSVVRATFFDVDGDKRLDLLEAGTPPRLFRNQGGKWTPGEPLPVEGTVVDAAVEDFNRDGVRDVFFLRWRKPPVLLLNRGGKFVDVTAQSGFDRVRPASYSAVAFDYDGDGVTDVLIGGQAAFDEVAWELLAPGARISSATPRLFRNLGDAKFSEVTAETGFGAIACGTQQAFAADLDADGWIDLFFANGSPDAQRLEPSFAMHNEKGKRFSKWVPLPPANHVGATFVGFDPEHRPEVYLAPNPLVDEASFGGVIQLKP